MVIKILGTGCSKCKLTVANVHEAIKQTGVQGEVVKVEDFEGIMKYDVMATPALLIDEVVKVKGRVATVDEIKSLLKA